jgi:putative peptidoglycan lipid II flippase
MGLNVALSLTLPTVFASAGLQPFGGLALANSIATLLEFGVLLVLMRRRMNGIHSRRMVGTFAKSSLAALAMVVVLGGWKAALPRAGSLILGGGGVVLGLSVYLVGSILLRTEELQAVARVVRRA